MNLRTLTDIALAARFSELIRKKYPYQPHKTRRERVVRLSPDEERELWECAHETIRRESLRLWKLAAPKQLTLFNHLN